MNHPLIDLLPQAGDLTRTVARNLRLTNYGAFNLRDDLFALTDALVTDATGVSHIHDRTTIDDRDSSRVDRDAAKARRDLRTAVSDLLAELPKPWRVALIDGLAEGRGEQTAAALQRAADQTGEAVIAALRDAAMPAAAEAV